MKILVINQDQSYLEYLNDKFEEKGLPVRKVGQGVELITCDDPDKAMSLIPAADIIVTTLDFTSSATKERWEGSNLRLWMCKSQNNTQQIGYCILAVALFHHKAVIIQLPERLSDDWSDWLVPQVMEDDCSLPVTKVHMSTDKNSDRYSGFINMLWAAKSLYGTHIAK